MEPIAPADTLIITFCAETVTMQGETRNTLRRRAQRVAAHRRASFTVVELLVVLAIIAVLIALLLPAI